MTDYIYEHYGNEIQYNIVKHEGNCRIVVMQSQSELILYAITLFSTNNTKEIQELNYHIANGKLIGVTARELGQNLTRKINAAFQVTNVVVDNHEYMILNGLMSQLYINGVYYCSLYELINPQIKIAFPKFTNDEVKIMQLTNTLRNYITFQTIINL